jgi:hypothetical protein
MKKTLSLITATTLMASSPAIADPTYGLGLTVTFGGGQVDYGIGARVFSDDEEDEVVASLGVDYMFGTQSLRGSLGAAYLMSDSYLGVDTGYNFGTGQWDYGFNAGWADTATPVSPTPQAECEASGGFWTGNSCV